jgi:hypothetical protein
MKALVVFICLMSIGFTVAAQEAKTKRETGPAADALLGRWKTVSEVCLISGKKAYDSDEVRMVRYLTFKKNGVIDVDFRGKDPKEGNLHFDGDYHLEGDRLITRTLDHQGNVSTRHYFYKILRANLLLTRLNWEREGTPCKPGEFSVVTMTPE